jgi:hypothetical protein
MSSYEPYHSQDNKYPITNTEKGRFGEQAFTEALSDFPILMNITYGKRQKDIDHLVFTSKSVIMNECKNNNENFFMYYSWFEDRVFDRFVEGLPIAQFYAKTLGCPVKDFIFTLTIPRLNTEPRVKLRLKQIKIHVIETKRQILKAKNKKQWYPIVRGQILSVINNQTNNTASFNEIDNSSKIHYNKKGIKDDGHSLSREVSLSAPNTSNHCFSDTLYSKNNSNTKTENESDDGFNLNSDNISNSLLETKKQKSRQVLAIAKGKNEPKMPPDIVQKLQSLSLHTAFPLQQILSIYHDELELHVRRGKVANIFKVAYLTTQGRIKEDYHSFYMCNYCRNLHEYGCGKYRLAVKFRKLHNRAWRYFQYLQDENLQNLISEIVSEFGGLHLRVVKCARKKSYQKRVLNFNTMNLETEVRDSSFNETISAFLDPEKEIRQELEKLKKEKEQLQQWKQASKKGRFLIN